MSQDLIYTRYERDLTQVLSHLELTEPAAQLNFEKSLDVFVQMGFVTVENKLDLETFNQLWSVMSKEDTTMQTNLNTYMCAIQNLNLPWMQTAKIEGQATLNASEITALSL